MLKIQGKPKVTGPDKGQVKKSDLSLKKLRLQFIEAAIEDISNLKIKGKDLGDIDDPTPGTKNFAASDYDVGFSLGDYSVTYRNHASLGYTDEYTYEKTNLRTLGTPLGSFTAGYGEITYTPLNQGGIQAFTIKDKDLDKRLVSTIDQKIQAAERVMNRIERREEDEFREGNRNKQIALLTAATRKKKQV